MASTDRDVIAAACDANFCSSLGNHREKPSGSRYSISSADAGTCQLSDPLIQFLPDHLIATITRAVNTAIVLHATNDGATVSLMEGDLAGQECYAVSIYPQRALELPIQPCRIQLLRFTLDNLNLLLLSGHALGTWFNRSRGIHILDVVVCPSDRSLALELGSHFKQWSIFDLAKGQEVLVVPAESTLPAYGEANPCSQSSPPKEVIGGMDDMAKRRFEIETESGYVYQGNRLVGHVSSLLRERSSRGKQIKRQWDGYMHKLEESFSKSGPILSSARSKREGKTPTARFLRRLGRLIRRLFLNSGVRWESPN